MTNEPEHLIPDEPPEDTVERWLQTRDILRRAKAEAKGTRKSINALAKEEKLLREKATSAVRSTEGQLMLFPDLGLKVTLQRVDRPVMEKTGTVTKDTLLVEDVPGETGIAAEPGGEQPGFNRDDPGIREARERREAMARGETPE